MENDDQADATTTTDDTSDAADYTADDYDAADDPDSALNQGISDH